MIHGLKMPVKKEKSREIWCSCRLDFLFGKASRKTEPEEREAVMKKPCMGQKMLSKYFIIRQFALKTTMLLKTARSTSVRNSEQGETKFFIRYFYGFLITAQSNCNFL